MTDAHSPASPAETTTAAPKPTPRAFDADPEGVAEHVLVWRDALLEAALPIAAERGWTRDALRAAELADPDLGPGIAALACPAGVVDVLDHWGLRADQAMARTLADGEAPKRIRDKVAGAVRARIAAIGERHHEAARRAAARLALPDAAMRGAHIAWRASDRMWRAVGDTSTDGNFYSKRAILTGVFTSTLAVWLAQDTIDEAWARADATLARRIDGVMQFEKLKAGAQNAAAQLPNILGLATALRYGR